MTMDITNIIAEFYSSHQDEVKNMSRMLYTTAHIGSNTEILQALTVGTDYIYLRDMFEPDEIEQAYKDLSRLVMDMANTIGEPCLLIADKDDVPMVGYFICEVRQIKGDKAIVSIGVFDEKGVSR